MAFLVYDGELGTPGTTTMNATPNTETDVVDFLAGVRNMGLQLFTLIGKAAALTTISGLAFRFAFFSTGSTGGTTVTPHPRDPGAQAAKTTVKSAPTAGSTRTNGLVIGCGAAGPGLWQAQNPDSAMILQGGATNTLDVMSVSGTASLGFEWGFELFE